MARRSFVPAPCSPYAPRADHPRWPKYASGCERTAHDPSPLRDVVRTRRRDAGYSVHMSRSHLHSLAAAALLVALAPAAPASGQTPAPDKAPPGAFVDLHDVAP